MSDITPQRFTEEYTVTCPWCGDGFEVEFEVTFIRRDAVTEAQTDGSAATFGHDCVIAS